MTRLEARKDGARIGLYLAVAAALALPILLVRWPPILDLPQQMDQLRLFARALDPTQDAYRIQWLSPNKSSYPLLAVAWAVGGARWGPRFGLLLCVLAMLAAIHLLGATFRRPLPQAALASVFVLSSPTYGGFLNFLVGALACWWWLGELGSEPSVRRNGRKLAARAFLGGLLLYLGHAVWLAAGVGLTVVSAWMHPRAAVSAHAAWRAVGWRMLGLLPWIVGTAVWLRVSAGPGEPATWSYLISPVERIAEPGRWPMLLLGGLRGPVEPILLAAVAIWAAACLIRNRDRPRLGMHRALSIAGAAFLIAGILLPDILGESQLFARRWIPWAGVCLVLALPDPALRKSFSRLLPGAVVAALALATLQVWRAYDTDELRGFEPALAAVPDHCRLLSLDFVLYSPRLWGPPYFQLGSYAQLDRDVELGFSFAQLRSSLVVLRPELRNRPWTWGLEVQADRLKPSDLRYFDYVLIHLPETLQANVPRKLPALERVAGRSTWMLCRVRPSGDRGG